MPARKSPLRAVQPHERAVSNPVTIEQAADRDDELWQLRLTRRVIARKLDDPNCAARDMAALSKRLMELGKEIAAIEARAVEDSGSHVEVTDGEFDASAV